MSLPQQLLESRTVQKTANIGLVFIRWPETQLQINANVQKSLAVKFA